MIARIAAEDGRELVRLDTGRGLVLADATRDPTHAGRTRFAYSIMNVDYGPGVRSVTIPLAKARNTRAPFFIDGDDDASNDWVAKKTDVSIIFKAPPGAELTWGALVTFGFEANRTTGGDEIMVDLMDGNGGKAVRFVER